jgi:hypothetical protein
MSLIETIQLYNDNQSFSNNDLTQYPFLNQIIDKTFESNIELKSLEELSQALTTYSYLNIDSSKVIEEFLWLLGGNRIKFNDYFETCIINNDNDYFQNNKIRYKMKSDINNIIKCELKQYFNSKNMISPFAAESLNVKFQNIYTDECIKCGNLRLLIWGAKNLKLSIGPDSKTFNHRFHHTTSVMRKSNLINMAVEYKQENILKWLEQNYIL